MYRRRNKLSFLNFLQEQDWLLVYQINKTNVNALNFISNLNVDCFPIPISKEIILILLILDICTMFRLQESNISYFLPHRSVLKEDSSITKIRVLFNGSFHLISGFSINDLQMDCPVIQSDLFSFYSVFVSTFL